VNWTTPTSTSGRPSTAGTTGVGVTMIGRDGDVEMLTCSKFW
jgi:hypothetical protein